MTRKTCLIFLMLAQSLTPIDAAGQLATRVGPGDLGRSELGRSDQDQARAAVARGEILGLSQILAIVTERHPGQVVEVEFDDDDNVQLYEIELLTAGGRLIEIEVDAVTGRIIGMEDEDS